MSDNPFPGNDTPLELLRNRWSTVPFGISGRISTSVLVDLDDDALLAAWGRAWAENCQGTRGFEARGWYQLVYADWVRNKKIIDIGSGLGFDSIHFASLGARVTFVDLAESNLRVVQRICALKGITDCGFLVLRQMEDLEGLDADYDAVFSFGSLHHAPESIIRPEMASLARRLKPDGRFIQHAYPKSRWERDGQPPFHEWGIVTDGEGTPWAEWYDPAKLQDMLRPERFDLVFSCDYRDGEMNCIDLVRRSPEHVDSLARIPNSHIQLKRGIDLYGLLIDKAWGSSAELLQDGSVKLTANEQQWGYSALIPFQTPFQPQPGQTDYIRARLTVMKGKVGLSLLGENQTDVIGEEFAGHGVESVICLSVPPETRLSGLLIRNVAPGNVQSVLVIHELSYFVPT